MLAGQPESARRHDFRASPCTDKTARVELILVHPHRWFSNVRTAVVYSTSLRKLSELLRRHDGMLSPAPAFSSNSDSTSISTFESTTRILEIQSAQQRQLESHSYTYIAHGLPLSAQAPPTVCKAPMPLSTSATLFLIHDPTSRPPLTTQ